MGWFTGCVLYLLIWWLVLFAVLPFGVQPASDPDPHAGWRGAPEHPRLLKKIIITTLIAAVVWFGAYLLISSDYISFRHGMFAAPQD
jgi:predicted secreted protein